MCGKFKRNQAEYLRLPIGNENEAYVLYYATACRNCPRYGGDLANDPEGQEYCNDEQNSGDCKWDVKLETCKLKDGKIRFLYKNFSAFNCETLYQFYFETD